MNDWPGPITNCDLGPDPAPPEWWADWEWNALMEMTDDEEEF